MGGGGFKDSSTTQSNAATPFLEEFTKFLGGEGGPAQEQFGFASDLQRNIGEGIQQFIASQAGEGEFAASRSADLLDDRFELNLDRALDATSEIFGAGGTRFGTPLAVGAARTAEGITAGQNALLADLFFRGHEGAQNRMLGGFQAGTTLGSSITNPLLQFASLGREDTVGRPGIATTIGGFVNDIVPG